MAIIINTVTVKNEPKWRQNSLCRDDIDMCYCLGHNISGDQGNLVTSAQWSVPYDAGEAGHRAEQKLIYCSWLLVTFFPISIMSIGSGIENNIAEAWSNTISNGNTCVRIETTHCLFLKRITGDWCDDERWEAWTRATLSPASAHLTLLHLSLKY